MDWFTATMDGHGSSSPRSARRRRARRGLARARAVYRRPRASDPVHPARAYGALGTCVAERLIGGSGRIRERFLDIAPDGASGRTEIARPVLRMAG